MRCFLNPANPTVVTLHLDHLREGGGCPQGRRRAVLLSRRITWSSGRRSSWDDSGSLLDHLKTTPLHAWSDQVNNDVRDHAA